ncbi:uncharacterized protein SPSK_05702 [Sporothrix schenckii 1099-18]|uniref:Uncharacterized protein n=1 Tax=Sporothrix schenckii 1099-18 TaxID=1397361 RepID=A0A0F2LX43_SPOSC|nr:uncharacterized protein SPSK_05702 [Sporothrix schenckii 1099-18]KJR81065.1 hypothetical protein SPSK_05702 [Sporothrix schenckii 1099-18]
MPEEFGSRSKANGQVSVVPPQMAKRARAMIWDQSQVFVASADGDLLLCFRVAVFLCAWNARPSEKRPLSSACIPASIEASNVLPLCSETESRPAGKAPGLEPPGRFPSSLNL